MRRSVRLLSSAMFCAATLAAHADTLNFSITGADGTYSFSLPSSATPTYSSSSVAQFTLATAVYNGRSVANDTVDLFSLSSGGGLYLSNGSTSYFINEFGRQLYTGSAQLPVFTTGTFVMSSANSSFDCGSDSGDVLTISSSSPVPEPSALMLVGTGLAGLAGAGVRTLRRAG